jgi:hypothetical protein
MSENTITELRGHLFDTMRALKSKDQPMDIERAKAIADVAQTIINSAKVEVEHMKIAGGKGSGFIPELPQAPGLPDGATVIAQKPGVTVTRHTLKG